MVPDFRADGYLPEGLHLATEAEVTFRFGSASPRRRRLVLRLRRWLELARLTSAERFLVDGSFVTAKAEPHDIDAVVLLAPDFEAQITRGTEAALELEGMLLTRSPEDLRRRGYRRLERLGRILWADPRIGREAQGPRGDSTVITNPVEYEKGEEELRRLEQRLEAIQQVNPLGSKGFTKAGIRKMIARIHEELAAYEGSEEARQGSP